MAAALSENLPRQLEELQLLRCSLFRGESLTFLLLEDSAGVWDRLVDGYPSSLEETDSSADLEPACFELRVESSPFWFEIKFPFTYPNEFSASVAVKGVNVSREQQERWQALIRDELEEMKSSESQFPIYELFSTIILPRWYAEVDSSCDSDLSTSLPVILASEPTYHVLFTSHHLVSPTKRRNMQQWSFKLSLKGFAKVGYPGVIYAVGRRSSVEEFAANVKAMQWLALRMRFMEVLADGVENGQPHHDTAEWKEFQKIGEVVEEMRMIGREGYVLELGIGSSVPVKHNS